MTRRESPRPGLRIAARPRSENCHANLYPSEGPFVRGIARAKRESAGSTLSMNQTKRTGTAVAIGLASLMALAVFIMGAPEPGSAGVDMSSTSGLYASGRDGSVTLVAQIGAIAPDGDVFNDLGVPSISPEGDVVFGAETIGQDNRPRWNIYRAKPGAPGNQRIVPVLDGVSITKDCRPNLKTDPYAVAGP